MVRPVDELDEVAFLWETFEWLHRKSKRKLNRSKRKRKYRIQKRYQELVNLEMQERFLKSLNRVIGEISRGNH